MGNQKRTIWILIGVVALVLLVAIFIFYDNRTTNQANAPTRSALPAAVAVPDEGSQNVAADVAVPKIQVPAAPGSSASFRGFSITIAANAYSPNTIVVNQGDSVDLEITATDADYGFTQPDYGFNVVIKKGKTQRVEFQALQSGNFTFYCASCGGPAKGPIGHLIVNAL